MLKQKSHRVQCNNNKKRSISVLIMCPDPLQGTWPRYQGHQNFSQVCQLNRFGQGNLQTINLFPFEPGPSPSTLPISLLVSTMIVPVIRWIKFSSPYCQSACSILLISCVCICLRFQVLAFPSFLEGWLVYSCITGSRVYRFIYNLKKKEMKL